MLWNVGDADLRELERKWRETGLVEDGVVCLLARVRGGALDHERLMLAAYLGDDAAYQALGAAPPDFPPTRPASSFAEWVECLYRAIEVSDGPAENRVVAGRRAAYEILSLSYLPESIDVEVPPQGEAGPIRCLVEDLLPWALGDGDPVRERVEARQRVEAAGE